VLIRPRDRRPVFVDGERQRTRAFEGWRRIDLAP
jgi:hypothetical protein